MAKPDFAAFLDWLDQNQQSFPQSRKKKAVRPKHPGLVLQERLREHCLNQSELARRIGCTHAKVNEIINARRNISPAFAIDLEEHLGDPAEMWLSLQLRYDLFIQRERLIR